MRFTIRGALLVLLVGFLGQAVLPAAGVAQQPDWNRLDDPLYEALGVHLGMMSGTGLAYKFPVKWWLYGQVAGGIWNSSNDKRHNIGFESQYILRQDQRHRLFISAGFGHYYHKEDGRTKDNLNAGFGVGLESLRWERASIQVELNFTYRGDEEDMRLYPQVGAFFYF